MPPRKSTSSVTPAEADETSQLSPIQPTDKPITATEQQLKARAELGVSVEDYLLPRSLTVRLAKSVLPPNTTIQKDAVLAIQKAATVFVSYLSSQRPIVALALKKAILIHYYRNVFAALTDLEFDQFRGRLEQELEAYMEIKAGKRKAKKSDGNGAGDASGTGEGDSGIVAPHDGDEDVEMLDNPTKRVKRASEGGAAGGAGVAKGTRPRKKILRRKRKKTNTRTKKKRKRRRATGSRTTLIGWRISDKAPRPMDPDAEETEDEDGPASQLRDDMGLG
ncbi:transcriptional regulator family: Histone-like TF [Penicillium chermesinum]|nr:transcriptional regulator family: Histone-like TF [Penicillium chermesinum]